MQIRIRADSVEIDGYVNAIERNSKPLWSRMGQFVERICKGAFDKALKRNNDVRILLNHDETRDLGGQKDGNLDLTEDSIGLRVHTVIKDEEVVRDAKEGNLVGWSFGFYDRAVESSVDPDTTLPLRKVQDLDLVEVSLLNRKCTPAYDGTLVMVRADGEKPMLRAMVFDDDTEIIKEDEQEDELQLSEEEEQRNEPTPEGEPVEDKKIDYSKYEQMISEMKGEKA